MKKVYAPGVFDLFHIGHLNYLKAASTAGDYLIVAIQEDRAVEKAKKITLSTPLPERIALIEQLRFVDEVISYIDVDQSKVLKAMGVSVFACGEEYGTDVNFPDQFKTLNYCKENNIEIFRIPRTENVSSTSIRERIKNFWSKRAEMHNELTAGVTVLGSFNGDNKKIEEESQREANLIMKSIKNPEQKTLIDLGCGDGRLLSIIASKFKKSTGVEFSPELIALAKKKINQSAANVNLITADVTNFEDNSTYDLILLSGITPCLDDEQYEKLLEKINQISHLNSKIILRTSLSLQKRINVVNQYSKDLGDIYTAYYRTISETQQSFDGKNWKIESQTLLYQNNTETAVFWIELTKNI